MLFLEQNARYPFVEIFYDSTTRDPLAMTGVTIEIVHYDESPTPVEIEDVAPTAMTDLGDGKFIHFQDIVDTTFEIDTIYYARIRGTHPTQLHEELTEQVFKVVGENSLGRLGREQFTEGDKRAFVVDYRDAGTRLPLDMGAVTVEIAYYDESPTPVELFALAPTTMTSLGDGRYVHLLEIDSNFPANTEFFVRYRGTHPDDGTEELVQEEFSSFTTPATGTGLDVFPVDPF